MTLAGHSLAHLPQPTQRPMSTWAAMPRATAIAPRGHTFTQQPQATQASPSTKALRAARFVFSNRHTAFLSRAESPPLIVPHYVPSVSALP